MKQEHNAHCALTATSTQTQLATPELVALAQKLQYSKVAVIGDIMLDHYQYGTASRISPEAPVPVVQIETEEYKLGGAGNVAQNISCLGGQTYLLAKTGLDREAQQLQHILTQHSIQHDLLSCKTWQTTLKTRVLAQGQQVVRIDKEKKDSGQNKDVEFCALIDKATAQCGTLIISDYGKGCITPAVLSRLGRQRDQGVKIMLDPKEQNYTHYHGLHIMTPNAREAAWFSTITLDNKKCILQAGDKILHDKSLHNLLITLGPAGMVLFTADSSVWKIPAATQKVFDVTGAGDTVIAVLAAAVAAGGTLLQGCVLANAAAGLVVGQVGAAQVSSQKLQNQLQKEPAHLGIEQWRQPHKI